LGKATFTHASRPGDELQDGLAILSKQSDKMLGVVTKLYFIHFTGNQLQRLLEVQLVSLLTDTVKALRIWINYFEQRLLSLGARKS